MRLSRLELVGFKSFLHKTTFRFEQGITALVGPNGCGKSNVLDAVLWVLGERGGKSLRVKEMEDVIFHGSDTLRPFGLAEVNIEFIDGARDVSVRRRIFRDGTNEYFINNRPARLKDVQDIFLGTGVGLNTYAIVEQGKIETFLSMKPQERRVLIEEASGITRFEAKKAEAYERMEEVRANLQRIADLCAEVRRSWEKAKVEWERWKRYVEITERLHEVERLILLEGLNRIEKRKKKIEEGLEDIERAATLRREERESIEEERRSRASEFSFIDKSLREVEMEMKEKEKVEQALLVEVRFLDEERKSLAALLATLEKEVVELTAEKEKEERRIAHLRRQTQSNDLRSEEERLRKKQREVFLLKKALAEKERILEEKRTRLFVVTAEAVEAKNRLLEADRRLAEAKARQDRRRMEREKVGNHRDELLRKRSALSEHKAILEARLSELALKEAELSSQRQDLLKLLEERTATLRRLLAEKEGKEEYLRMLTRGFEGRTCNPNRLVALLSVPKGKEDLIDSLLSRELEYTLCYEQDPISIAQMAREKRGGIVFFTENGLFRKEGDGVRLQVEEEATLEHALSRIKAGEEGIFFAEGLSIDSRGIIHGAKEGGPLKRRSEILTTQQYLKDLEPSIFEQQGLLESGRRELRSIEAALHGLKMEMDHLLEKRAQDERDIIAAEAELKAVEERWQAITHDEDIAYPFYLPVEELRLEMDKKEMERQTAERDFKLTKEEVDGLKGAHERLSSEYQRDLLELERRKARMRSDLEELQRCLKAHEGLEEEKRARQEKIEKTRRHLEEVEEKGRGIRNALERLKVERERLLQLFQNLSERLSEVKERMGALEEREKVVKEEEERLRRKREELEREWALLEERARVIRDKAGDERVLEKHLPPLGQLEKERERLLTEREALGEINFRAEKEFKELTERLSFLEKEKTDLELSLDGLKRTIRRIECYSKEVFLSTFQAVRDAFKGFVERLFEGGQGELRLNEENGGVEMLVRPRGKRVVRVESLSGGEKTLASLSLMLSLMDVKPAPFSILDEIDGPLDDANVLRLREILREMSRKTQLVLITHNRLTVEICDVVYGITMERDGVSKVVPVRI